MARRGRSNSRRSETFFRSLTERVRLPTPIRLSLPVVSRVEVEDRRRSHPLGLYRPARMVTGHPVGPLRPGRQIRRPDFLPAHVAFEVPKRTMICVRRQERREVLFAKMRTGGGAGKPRRRNRWSEVSCK